MLPQLCQLLLGFSPRPGNIYRPQVWQRKEKKKKKNQQVRQGMVCIQDSPRQELNCLVISLLSLGSLMFRGTQKQANKKGAKELLSGQMKKSHITSTTTKNRNTIPYPTNSKNTIKWDIMGKKESCFQDYSQSNRLLTHEIPQRGDEKALGPTPTVLQLNRLNPSATPKAPKSSHRGLRGWKVGWVVFHLEKQDVHFAQCNHFGIALSDTIPTSGREDLRASQGRGQDRESLRPADNLAMLPIWWCYM